MNVPLATNIRLNLLYTEYMSIDTNRSINPTKFSLPIVSKFEESDRGRSKFSHAFNCNSFDASRNGCDRRPGTGGR